MMGLPIFENSFIRRRFAEDGMNRRDILQTLSAFPYDRSEYWLITGGAMVLYGIRNETGDIDLGCTKEMADRLEADGFLYDHTAEGRRCFRYGDDIEIFEGWMEGRAVTVDGLQVVSLEGLLEMKRALGREKDLTDIALINEYLKRNDPEGGQP